MSSWAQIKVAVDLMDLVHLFFTIFLVKSGGDFSNTTGLKRVFQMLQIPPCR